MKRALFLRVLLCIAVPSVIAQEPDKAAATHYKVAEVGPGAISPDGRFLSYTDWSTGDLAVQDLKTGEKRHLTDKGSWLKAPEFAQAVQAISPDGKQVAYGWQSKNGCDLRIIGLDGSNPRVLYRNDEIGVIEPQDWSRDGKHILATILKKDRTQQTVLVSVADGSVRLLKTHSSPWNMAFSPDGRWVVYDFPPKEESPERDIYLLPTDGSRGTPLVEHPANDFVLGWAPDGKRVLFASDRAGTSGAWVIQVADGQPRGVPELVKPDIAPIAAGWLGLTRDGSYYYGHFAWVNDVYVATLDPATGTLQRPQKLVRHVGLNTSPDWSPDGRYLAYAWGRRGPYPFVLGIRTIRTGEVRRLRLKIHRMGGHAFQPHWSPDGRSLLAQGRYKGDHFYRIDAHTGEVTPIVQTQRLTEWPVWSSDGKAIFYRRSHRSNRSQSLVVRDLETGRERELYRGALPTALGEYVGASNLAVSPNGQRLAFVWSDFDEQGRTSTALKVISTATGGEPRELLRVHPPEVIFQPAWMPDGGHVLFGRGRRPWPTPGRSGQEPRFELWRISAEGGEPQHLGLAMKGLLLYGLSVHPDGRRIAFTAGRSLGSQTWVMENILPELKDAK